jgi:hypothetical protein
MGDAKVYAMIEDLSPRGLRRLSGEPLQSGLTDSYLRSFLRQQYETGELSETEIVMEWEDDE